VIDSKTGSYISGSVGTHIRSEIGRQGAIRASTSPTDLAISGDGFFVVQDASGSSYLTRTGSYEVDSEGNLVNPAGSFLMGYEISSTSTTRVANGFGGLSRINIGLDQLTSEPTRTGEFIPNLPASAPIVAAGSLPSDNVATSDFAGKTSLVVYDSLGTERVLDLYFAKTATNEWEVTIFDGAASTAGGFPYSSPPLVQDTLTFDPTNGYLVAGAVSVFNIPIPGGEVMTLEMEGISQLGADYTVIKANADGSSPASIERVEIDSDGLVYGIYDNGVSQEVYQLALATVPSPDNLRTLTGNNYAVTLDSGDVFVGNPNSEGMGSVISGALEESSVDMATELTIMIESQRTYTANSKVFQTGSDLMDVLVNLKR